MSGYVKTVDGRLSDSRNAADVYAWAKASTKPTYAYSEITGTPTIPTVYAWAQASVKPSYIYSEIGGTVPTWNQNTTGTAYNITQYTINQNLGTSNSPTFATGIFSANLTTQGELYVQPATGTNISRANFSNTSGTLYMGVDNSTGINFGFGNYARFIYSAGAYPLEIYSSNNLKLYSVGAMTLDGASTLTINNTATSFTQTAAFNSGLTGTIATLGGQTGYYGLTVNGTSTASNSFGIYVKAGTNATDAILRAQTYAGSDVFWVKGDGTISALGVTTISPSSNQHYIFDNQTNSSTASVRFDAYVVSGTGALLQLKNTNGVQNAKMLDIYAGTTEKAYIDDNGAGWFASGLTSLGTAITISNSQNANTNFYATNVNAGTAASAQYGLSNGSYNATFNLYGTGYTTSLSKAANRAVITTDGAGGLALVSQNAAFSIWTGNTEVQRLTVSTAGAFDFQGNTINSGAITSTGAITGNTIVKSGGTSSQYLMADGSTTTGGTATSGTYTPTLTNTTNISSSSVTSASYIKVGNIVHVTIGLTVAPTTGGANTVLQFTLPTASSLSTQSKVGYGTQILVGSSTFGNGVVDCNATTTATFTWYSATSISSTVLIEFQYSL